MMLVTMFWRLRQNLGVSWGGWVPIDAFEGGGSVGSFNLPSPSRCLMLPVLVLASVTKESDEQTPVGNCSLYKSYFSSYSLFPPCCPNVVQYQLLSLFLTFTLEPKCSGPFHYVNEKRCREGEHCHMSLPFAFHLRQTHFRAVSHNHFWSNQHNHSDHHRVILSRSGLTFLDMSLWANPD